MTFASPLTDAPAAPRRRRLIALAAVAGLLWNAFGIVRFAGTATATPEGLMAGGMTAEQATLYAGLPAWMTLAFAVGVFGGAIGSLAILFRRRVAVPVLAVSLASYAVLYAGDIGLGVFAAFGAPQVAILTLVLAIAAGLLALARWSASAGLLR